MSVHCVYVSLSVHCVYLSLSVHCVYVSVCSWSVCLCRYLKCEMYNPQYTTRFGVILEAYLKGCGEAMLVS